MLKGNFYTVTGNEKLAHIRNSFESNIDAEKHAKYSRKQATNSPKLVDDDVKSIVVNTHDYIVAPDFSGYTKVHEKIIQQELIKCFADEIKSFGVLSFQWSNDLVENGDGKFAVFHNVAFRLLPYETTPSENSLNVYKYKAVSVNGKMLKKSNNGQMEGLLYLLRCIKINGREQKNSPWGAYFISAAGWIHTNGLKNNHV